MFSLSYQQANEKTAPIKTYSLAIWLLFFGICFGPSCKPTSCAVDCHLHSLISIMLKSFLEIPTSQPSCIVGHVELHSVMLTYGKMMR